MHCFLLDLTLFGHLKPSIKDCLTEHCADYKLQEDTVFDMEF